MSGQTAAHLDVPARLAISMLTWSYVVATVVL